MTLAETIRRRQARVLKFLSALNSADRPAKKLEILRSLKEELENQNRSEREAFSSLGEKSPKLAQLVEESNDREREIGDLFREIELIESPTEKAREEPKKEVEAIDSTIEQLIRLIETHFDELNVLLFPEVVSVLKRKEIDELCEKLEAA